MMKVRLQELGVDLKPLKKRRIDAERAYDIAVARGADGDALVTEQLRMVGAKRLKDAACDLVNKLFPPEPAEPQKQADEAEAADQDDSESEGYSNERQALRMTA
jgi:hypothetical protein